MKKKTNLSAAKHQKKTYLIMVESIDNFIYENKKCYIHRLWRDSLVKKKKSFCCFFLNRWKIGQ